MVFGTPTLSDVEIRVREKIDDLRDKLSYSVSSPRWTSLLSRVSQAKAIQGSNSIEGYRVTLQDALAAVDGDEPLEAPRDTWRAIVGYRSAMAYVRQLADDRHFRFSADLVRSLHYTMTGYDLSRHPGRWRPGPIVIRNDATGETVSEGRDVERVPGLIDDMVADLNGDSVHPVMVRAAMAHLNLVMIHPFSDGNGRMARCLQSLVLAREGIVGPEFASIEEQLGRDQQAYYGVLSEVGQGRWHPEPDARPWVRFCLAAHYRQAVTVLRRSRESSRLCNAVDELIAKFKLPDRTFYALADTAEGFRLVNVRYRKAAEISQNLASRDLAQLCRLGLLEAQGERRGRFYTASEVTSELRQKTREPRVPMPDPFA